MPTSATSGRCFHRSWDDLTFAPVLRQYGSLPGSRTGDRALVTAVRDHLATHYADALGRDALAAVIPAGQTGYPEPTNAGISR